MKTLYFIHWVALLFVIIGALNTGMIGFFNIDVITGIFGGDFQFARIIFAIIGLAGIWSMIFLFKKIAYKEPKE